MVPNLAIEHSGSASAPTGRTSWPTIVGRLDIEYLYPLGWGELEGVASRRLDLSKHAELRREAKYFDTTSGERYVPYVIEPAAGLTRTVLAL